MQLKFVINTHFVFSTTCFVHDDAEFVSVTRQFIACELISLSLSVCEMLTHNATYQQTIVEMVTEGFLTSALAKLATKATQHPPPDYMHYYSALVLLLTFKLIITSIPPPPHFHSRLKTFRFCKSFPP